MTDERNIYQQQAHNRRGTVLVMLAFGALLAFLGYGFDAFILRNDLLRGLSSAQPAGPPPPPLGLMAALGIASLSALWSYYKGADAVLASSHARAIVPGDPATKQLEDVVEEMTIASGLPKPKVYVVPDLDPNAFATGRDPQHAYLAVTQGLLNKLNREELEAVVAHEMSHIHNLDIRLMTVVAALVGAVALLADWAGRVRWFRSSDEDSKGAGAAQLVVLVIWIVAIVLAPLASQLLAMAVSRRREYLADASGAELTRNPLALAAALMKIDATAVPARMISRGTAHLCIADPLGRKMSLKEGFWAELFSTHPPMAKRIAALQAMGYQYRQAEKA